METIQIVTERYRASDGVICKTREECEKHEEAIKDFGSGVLMYTLRGRPGNMIICDRVRDAHFIVTYGKHGYEKLRTIMAEQNETASFVAPKWEDEFCVYRFDGDTYRYIPFLYGSYSATELYNVLKHTGDYLEALYKKGVV